ncbi:MAG: PD-(D/E)XK motif protein [Asticcacaulis sp.]|nr:PD-(D/E)XK motif protein [Asticcacaulis sp.]
MTDDALERWKRLRNDGSGDGFTEVPSLPSVIETGYGPIRYALGPQGQPRLLIPCAPATTHPEIKPAARLSVTLTQFSVSGRPVRFIDVTCLDRTLDRVFAELAGDILNRVRDGGVPGAAVTGAIRDFRDLLENIAPEEIAESVIMGLLGELMMMERLAGFSRRAANCWTGPYEQRHDFRQDLSAIEVKTSGRSDKTTVSINGADQLAAPAGGRLVLVHYRVERTSEGPLSISSVCARLRQSGVDTEVLTAGLEQLGCSEPDGEAWNRVTFSPEGFAAYNVGAGFPRIVSSAFEQGRIPDGIKSLKYDVDLQHAETWRLSSEEFERFLSGMTS